MSKNLCFVLEVQTCIADEGSSFKTNLIVNLLHSVFNNSSILFEIKLPECGIYY